MNLYIMLIRIAASGGSLITRINDGTGTFDMRIMRSKDEPRAAIFIVYYVVNKVSDKQF